MGHLLLLVPDLMFGTRIEDTARGLGHTVAQFTSDDDPHNVLMQTRPQLVVLTFDRTGDHWRALAAAARAEGIPVLAFGSHMNVKAWQEARTLGCQVVANSRLHAELPALLTQAMA